MAVANTKLTLLATGRSYPLLSCSTNPVPASPLTVPPTVTVAVEEVQDTATFVTFAVAVPLPLATAHVCPDGGVATVTAYAAPEFTLVAKVKAPLLLMAW